MGERSGEHAKGTRPVRSQTAYPQKPHILGSKVDNLGVSSSAKADPDGRYTYVNRILDESGEIIAEPGDTWWRIYEMSDREVTGWVAELYKGVRYLTAKRVTAPTPDPVELPDVPFTRTLGDGHYYQKETITGTLKPIRKNE